MKQFIYLLDQDTALYAGFCCYSAKCKDFHGHNFGRISLKI